MRIVNEMNEYVIYKSSQTKEDVPEDWREQVTAQRGVSCQPTNMRGMVVKCDEATIEKLKKKFPHLSVEFIIPHETSEEEK